MAAVTHVTTLACVAQLLGEDLELLEGHCQVVSGDLRDGCFRCLMKPFRVHSLAKDRKHRIWRGDMILWSGGSGGVGRVC